MTISKVSVKNFGGIKEENILLSLHGVLTGDNSIGKTIILEAPDLVLGFDRLNRHPAIDEHDFFKEEYTAMDASPWVGGSNIGEAEITIII